jgi:hypothetical protein
VHSAQVYRIPEVRNPSYSGIRVLVFCPYRTPLGYLICLTYASSSSGSRGSDLVKDGTVWHVLRASCWCTSGCVTIGPDRTCTDCEGARNSVYPVISRLVRPSWAFRIMTGVRESGTGVSVSYPDKVPSDCLIRPTHRCGFSGTREPSPEVHRLVRCVLQA